MEVVKSFPVMEEFYTIQGEGSYSGRAAYFVRLGGCDVGCVWCDVKESWDAEKHPETTVTELLDKITATKTDFVVITGGEPAMYDLTYFVEELHKLGIEVAIETSGCYPLKGDIDWYCFSPKKFKAPVEDAYAKAKELKVVIFNKSDFKWAEDHAAKVNGDCKLYLQPEWSKEAKMLPLIIEYVKENPQWRISLQTHKYMQIP
ncbi:7-carboxy-7-deazaguanine synthase QueE [Lishizhenia sp.]|uniref:7-carboxy-7-deazaguanine synthase QueE n=1 Tax=Lishizhenia sp. TaxID=2497594 RepID=UPI00299D0C96|nr:7-carboxy-7-deazaguanine synthase QueE [Lishizhenia sp.]MDX1446137.1 7-carboxy-7-deazaguanine synthase QueE [Lishizhenia sp.]